MSTGHERRHLFMSNLDEPRFVARTIQSREDAVYAIARKSIDTLDAPFTETL
jgi:hypothetical protein